VDKLVCLLFVFSVSLSRFLFYVEKMVKSVTPFCNLPHNSKTLIRIKVFFQAFLDHQIIISCGTMYQLPGTVIFFC
jgi:hypothetical protein